MLFVASSLLLVGFETSAVVGAVTRQRPHYCHLPQQAVVNLSFVPESYPHELADSLVSAAQRRAWVHPPALAQELRSWGADTSPRSQRLTALAFRLAASKSPGQDVLGILAKGLGHLVRVGRIAPATLLVGRWKDVDEEQVWVVAHALAEAGSDSGVAYADELLGCLELDRIAPLFVAGTASSALDLSANTDGFVMAIRNLQSLGQVGRGAIERIVRASEVDQQLRGFVGRVIRGLAMERSSARRAPI